jgi:hypothetical protein
MQGGFKQPLTCVLKETPSGLDGGAQKFIHFNNINYQTILFNTHTEDFRSQKETTEEQDSKQEDRYKTTAGI